MELRFIEIAVVHLVFGAVPGPVPFAAGMLSDAKGRAA